MSPIKFTQLPDANQGTGYWGDITSTIDWCATAAALGTRLNAAHRCEENYAWTRYIAEWWNTWSNLPICLAGLWAVWWLRREKAETRFFVQAWLIVLVGLGSAMFHATLTFHCQLLDELPMVYALTVWWCVVFVPHRRVYARIGTCGPKRIV